MIKWIYKLYRVHKVINNLEFLTVFTTSTPSERNVIKGNLHLISVVKKTSDTE